jgi:hypothetical protein
MDKKVLSILLLGIIALLVAVMVWAIAASPFDELIQGYSCTGWRIGFEDGGYYTGAGRLPGDAARGVSYEVPADDITGIDLNFLHEDIEVVSWEGDTVKVEQTGSRTLAERDYMRYDVVNGELVAESGHIGRFYAGITPGSRITVSVPASVTLDGNYVTASGWVSVNGGQYGRLLLKTASGKAQAFHAEADSVSISTASGEAEVRGLQAGTCKISTASGNIDADGVYRDRFEADTASGNIQLGGQAASVDLNTASGNMRADVAGLRAFEADSASGEITLTCRDADLLREIKADTMSGSVHLQLPENDGFTLDYNSFAAMLRNPDFEMKGNQHKNGAIMIEVDTAAGSLSIEKI